MTTTVPPHDLNSNQGLEQPSLWTAICKTCQQEQPLENFYLRKKGVLAGSHFTECKACTRATNRVYAAKSKASAKHALEAAAQETLQPQQKQYDTPKKTCNTCGRSKPLPAFPLLKSEGRASRCKECQRAVSRQQAQIRRDKQVQERIEASLALAWEERIRQKQRKSYDGHLKAHFGKTLEEYEEMVREQQGKCAICGKTPDLIGERLFVDHSHVTGAVRGLLCQFCNSGLGFFKDSPESLQRAVEYIRYWQPWEEIVETS